MNDTLEIQMLNALEFFHYSYRFQHHLFILSLAAEIDLANIVTDLRVLNAAKIYCVVVVADTPGLVQAVDTWTKRGYPFEFMPVKAGFDFSESVLATLRTHYQSGHIPVIGLGDSQVGSIDSIAMDRFAIQLAQHFAVDKVFFLSKHDGLQIADRFVSHLTPQEAQNQVDDQAPVNIGRDRLTFFIHSNLAYGFEIVLLKGQAGCLFLEIFTHRGKGTLLTNDYPNIIRRGQISDVMDIALLLKPYVSSGAILPVSEDAIADEVEDYYVYTVNNSIVAISKLTDHGPAIELAKFCTLPRYQGKGRARELAEKMIKTVKQANKEFIFALSIEPKMFDFFKSLGFEECDRDVLPEQWKKQYDMSRSSKAFKLIV